MEWLVAKPLRRDTEKAIITSYSVQTHYDARAMRGKSEIAPREIRRKHRKARFGRLKPPFDIRR